MEKAVHETLSPSVPLVSLFPFNRSCQDHPHPHFQHRGLHPPARLPQGICDYAEYGDYLEVHPQEFGPLFDTVLINVTSFFRDPAAWTYLAETILPRIADERLPEPIRVWSAGCSSGEEAYTLAMLLVETVGEEAFRQKVKIYATDVDEGILATARLGSFEPRQVADIPAPFLEKYFEQNGNRHVFRNDLLAMSRRWEGTVDMLVTDVIMPKMNGSQLADEMLRERPALSVLYISGHPEDAIARHGVLHHPGRSFLQKPFAPGALLRKVKETLERNR